MTRVCRVGAACGSTNRVRAAGKTAPTKGAVPTTVTRNPFVLVQCRAIRWQIGCIVHEREAVLYPLRDVAVHVVEPKGIRREGAGLGCVAQGRADRTVEELRVGPRYRVPECVTAGRPGSRGVFRSPSVNKRYPLTPESPSFSLSHGRYSRVMSSQETLMTGRLPRPQPSSSGGVQRSSAKQASHSSNVTSNLPTAQNNR